MILKPFWCLEAILSTSPHHILHTWTFLYALSEFHLQNIHFLAKKNVVDDFWFVVVVFISTFFFWWFVQMAFLGPQQKAALTTNTSERWCLSTYSATLLAGISSRTVPIKFCPFLYRTVLIPIWIGSTWNRSK